MILLAQLGGWGTPAIVLAALLALVGPSGWVVAVAKVRAERSAKALAAAEARGGEAVRVRVADEWREHSARFQEAATEKLSAIELIAAAAATSADLAKLDRTVVEVASRLGEVAKHVEDIAEWKSSKVADVLTDHETQLGAIKARCEATHSQVKR